MWVGLVVGGFFFPFLHKNQHFQFQFGLATVDKKNRLMSTTKSHIFYQDWETVRCKYLLLIFIVDYLWLMVTRQLIKFQHKGSANIKGQGQSITLLTLLLA